jgi:hypothetical protein
MGTDLFHPMGTKFTPGGKFTPGEVKNGPLVTLLTVGSVAGVLKAIHCGSRSDLNRITKDTVCFHAADFPKLAEKLQLDLHEPPMSQVFMPQIRSFYIKKWD